MKHGSLSNFRALLLYLGLTLTAGVVRAEDSVTPPWNGQDIGAAGASGGGVYASNNFNYTVAGAGADIGGASDAFHFTYFRLTGDGSLTARVVSLTNTNAAAKAGVMMRSDLTAGAAFAATFVTPTNATIFQNRAAVNTAAVSASASGSAPYYVRISRTGSTFTSSVSSNGGSFTPIGTVAIPMSGPIYVGFAVSSRSASVLCSAVFDTVTATPTPAISADAFIESFGVVTHWNYPNTPYGYNYSGVKSRLVASGIRYYRDGPNNQIQDLAASGLKINLGVDVPNNANGNAATISSIVAQVKQYNSPIAAVASVEGPNEPDLFWKSFSKTYFGNGFPIGTAQFQKDLYTALKADSGTASLPVFGFALGNTYGYGSNPIASGALTNYVDYGNAHPYPGGNPFSAHYAYDTIDWYIGHGTQPSANIDEWPYTFDVYQPPYGLKPMVATETGYFTGTADNSVSQTVFAKYVPRLLLEYFRRGIRKTYLYEFADEFNNLSDNESCRGLLYNDNTPKPAYTALQSLIGVLQERGANFTPGNLAYSLSVNPPAGYNRTQYVRSLLMQKSDGTFYLVLYHEIADSSAYDSGGTFHTGTTRDIAPPNMPTTVTLPAGVIASASLYSYDSNWLFQQTPIAIVNNQISLNTPDTVVVLRLSPNYAVAPSAPTGLTAAPGNQSAALTWNPAAGAVAYNVKRAAVTGGPYTTVAAGIVPFTFTDTGLTNGTTVYYVVSATNNVGESANSNEANATPRPVVIGAGNGLAGNYYTGDPFVATGTPLHSQVDATGNFNINNDIGWNARPFDSGVPATHFTAVWTGQVLIPVTGSYVFTTVSDDAARLTLNGSVVISNTTYHAVTANNSAALAFTAGQRVDMKLEYSQGTANAAIQLLWAYPNQAQQIIPQSQLYSVIVPNTPQAPKNLTAAAANSGVNLSWNAAYSATSYNIKRATVSGGPYVTIATGVAATAYLDAGLTNGKTVYYVVSAANSVGESPNSGEASAAPNALAGVLAWWRFEDGMANRPVPPQPGYAAPDLSGHNNTLITDAAGTAPTYAADSSGPLVNPALSNYLSVDFSAPPTGGNALRSLYAPPTAPLNSQSFSQFTIEASVKFNRFTGTQTFVGRDGNGIGTGDQNVAALAFEVPDPATTNNIPVLSVRAHQLGGAYLLCDGTTPLQTNVWYNVVAVMNGSALTLYLQSVPGGAYHLENSVAFKGPLYQQSGYVWSVGRGYYADANAYPFTGRLDEMRISNVALSPAQFLSPGIGSVSGSVALEGLTNPGGANPAAPVGPLTFTLRPDSGNPFTLTQSLAADGSYTLANIPAGNYTLAIKGAKWLQRRATFALSFSHAVGVNVTLPAGDANNDNSVDSSDFTALIGSFNSDAAIPGSGYDPTADFNSDGLVDSSDFTLLIGNFGRQGDP